MTNNIAALGLTLLNLALTSNEDRIRKSYEELIKKQQHLELELSKARAKHEAELKKLNKSSAELTELISEKFPAPVRKMDDYA